jgi:hypothetical protein
MCNLDLAITNINSNSTSVLLGDGTGGFAPPSNIPNPGGKSPDFEQPHPGHPEIFAMPNAFLCQDK